MAVLIEVFAGIFVFIQLFCSTVAVRNMWQAHRKLPKKDRFLPALVLFSFLFALVSVPIIMMTGAKTVLGDK